MSKQSVLWRLEERTLLEDRRLELVMKKEGKEPLFHWQSEDRRLGALDYKDGDWELRCRKVEKSFRCRQTESLLEQSSLQPLYVSLLVDRKTLQPEPVQESKDLTDCELALEECKLT